MKRREEYPRIGIGDIGQPKRSLVSTVSCLLVNCSSLLHGGGGGNKPVNCFTVEICQALQYWIHIWLSSKWCQINQAWGEKTHKALILLTLVLYNVRFCQILATVCASVYVSKLCFRGGKRMTIFFKFWISLICAQFYPILLEKAPPSTSLIPSFFRSARMLCPSSANFLQCHPFLSLSPPPPPPPPQATQTLPLMDMVDIFMSRTLLGQFDRILFFYKFGKTVFYSLCLSMSCILVCCLFSFLLTADNIGFVTS